MKTDQKQTNKAKADADKVDSLVGQCPVCENEISRGLEERMSIPGNEDGRIKHYLTGCFICDVWGEGLTPEEANNAWDRFVSKMSNTKIEAR